MDSIVTVTSNQLFLTADMFFVGGIPGVKAIVVGNRLRYPISNFQTRLFVFHSANSFEKPMKSIILSLAMVKQLGRMNSLTLIRQPVK